MSPKPRQTRRFSLFAEPASLAVCGDVPVQTYGYTHILSAAPDLLDDAAIQGNNTSPLRKLAVKQSAQIAFNRLGGTSPRMPRTADNDYLPLECIHLIDGDPQTCWCSKSQPQPDAEPVWIRLDLPVERELSRIVLRKRLPLAERLSDGSSMPLDTGAVEIGMALPAELTIRISRDARTWETVFDGPSGDTAERV